MVGRGKYKYEKNNFEVLFIVTNEKIIIFAPKLFNMTLQRWIKDRAIHGFPTFSIEDARQAGLCSSEQILQNELSRLSANKTIANVYRGFYVIFPVQYVLRGSIPAPYYIDQLMNYLRKPYYVCMLSAAELLGAAHRRPQQFSVMTTFPKRSVVSRRNVATEWFYREQIPEECIITKNTETGTIRISNALLTAADLVQYQQHIGGLARAATIIEELTEQIDIKKHFRLLVPFVKSVVWQRLGYLLENIIEEKELADELYIQLRSVNHHIQYTPLSTTATSEYIARDSRWKININTQIEIDEQ